MGETLDIPKVGPVKKPVVIGIVAVGAAYVGWRYYEARQAAAASTDATDTSGTFGDGGTLPTVPDAYTGQDVGYPDGTDTAGGTVDSYGFTGTTNSQWTQYVTTQLEQSSDWSYSSIVGALGQFIANKPLTTAQQQIVQAAIAVAGYPPEGQHSIIPGGDAPLTVAPSGVAVTATTSTTATVTFNRVAGAGYYRVYRSGASTNVGAGDGPPITVSGLQPNTSYSFAVAADTTSGTPGPKSASVTAKTKAVTLATPRTPTVGSITATSAAVSTGAVSGATGYNWYVNGVAHGHSDAPSYTLSGLKAKTSYRVSVAADNNSQSPGKQSAQKAFTTKAK